MYLHTLRDDHLAYLGLYDYVSEDKKGMYLSIK